MEGQMILWSPWIIIFVILPAATPIVDFLLAQKKPLFLCQFHFKICLHFFFNVQSKIIYV